MVFPGFNEASGTSARNRPCEPATSKPCRPQGLCTVSIVEVGKPCVRATGAWMRTFDVVVIGAGPAGEVAAGRLGAGGLSVAIVEDRLVGGECSYWACMPSKALLRPYEALEEARRIPGAAQAIAGRLDVQAVLDRRDEVIHDLDDAVQLPWLEDRGIALLRGSAEITGERRVRVGGEELEATRAGILATGSLPPMPPVEGLDAIDGAWTNREATTAKAIPERLVIMGGGVVGVEMAQAFQTLGSQVS